VPKWLLCFHRVYLLYLFLLVILLLNLSVLCHQPSCFTVIVESTVTRTRTPHAWIYSGASQTDNFNSETEIRPPTTPNMGQTTNYHRTVTFSSKCWRHLYSTYWNSPILLIQILPDYYLHLNELEYYCSLANELECTLKNIGVSKIFLKKLIIVFNKNALKWSKLTVKAFPFLRNFFFELLCWKFSIASQE